MRVSSANTPGTDYEAWIATVIGLAALQSAYYTGMNGILVFIATGLVLGFWRQAEALRLLPLSPLIWVFPAFVLLSAFWSDVPGTTVRHGIQLLLTILWAVLAARRLHTRALVSAILVALALNAVPNILFGKTASDLLTGEWAFMGLFSSKNQLGLMVLTMTVCGLAVLLDQLQPKPMRLVGALSIVMAIPLLILSRSATSFVTVALGAVLIFALLLLARLPPTARALLALAVFLTLLPLGLLLGDLDELAGRFITDVLGKDLTLTGRTDLWERAFILIPDRPWLGWGYMSFWRIENLEAVLLWRRFNVQGGFHFHNLWIEQTIALGYVGASILAVTFLAALRGAFAWSWRDRTPASVFFLVFLLVLIVRSMAEVDFAHFAVPSVLFYMGVVAAERDAAGQTQFRILKSAATSEQPMGAAG